MSPLLIAGLIVLIVLAAVAVALLIRLAAEISATKTTAEASTRTAQVFAEGVTKRLESFERTIDGRIQGSQEALGQSLATMQKSSADATRLVQTVGEHLGRVVEFSQQMAGLGTELSRLQDLFKSPKVRGGLGEQLLEDALRQVLPAASFEMQKRFSGGETVDAAIRLGDRWVSVDSKFPLENFRRAADLENETERKNARSQFLRDVRKHIEAIASKYIRPAEGTFDFALMYVPAEAVYAEIVAESGEGSLVDLALARRVVPVSPLLFYTYLYTISVGLKGMEIEKRAHDILKELGDLKRGVSKIEDPFGKLGGHLDNAKKQYEETSRQISRFVERLRDITDSDEVPAQPPLPLRILLPPE
ncbi:MAG: DNA recombination protein RmuC [Thermoanaerobaculia bacterium]